MKSFCRFLLCILFTGLAGCVPWPHHQITAPRITGTVIHAGKPVVGTPVMLTDVMEDAGNIADTAQSQETVTDAQGHFSLGPIRRFSWHASVPLVGVSQHTAPWALLLGAGEVYASGWVSDPTLFGEVPHVPLVATCDDRGTEKSSVIKGDIALVGYGLCELAVSESKK